MTLSHSALRPDARLVFRLRGGRLVACRCLYRRHYAAAFSYAYCRFGDSAHATQLTEQAFHALFCQLTSMPAQSSGGTGFTAWVARGAVWPVTDDQRWLNAFRQLSLPQQLVLWHAVVEAEAPSSVAAIAGPAFQHVPQARADVLDTRLRHFQLAGEGGPVGRPPRLTPMGETLRHVKHHVSARDADPLVPARCPTQPTVTT
ncbi:hypothetical protein AB5J72_41715 [Streptomyces sp. CG1]|uniref:hypothetical protein n=1 Tax=Streptomyces sp. CG1 TaxID=1287523 RepID=UPI0034E270AA